MPVSLILQNWLSNKLFNYQPSKIWGDEQAESSNISTFWLRLSFKSLIFQKQFSKIVRQLVSKDLCWMVPAEINWQIGSHTAKKMRLSIKDFFSKCDQIHSFVTIWSYLLKKTAFSQIKKLSTWVWVRKFAGL